MTQMSYRQREIKSNTSLFILPLLLCECHSERRRKGGIAFLKIGIPYLKCVLSDCKTGKRKRAKWHGLFLGPVIFCAFVLRIKLILMRINLDEVS